MPTAREKARRAVELCCEDPKAWRVDIADAVSDVWEPLIRKVVSSPKGFKGIRDGIHYTTIRIPTSVLTELKEALGEK